MTLRDALSASDSSIRLQAAMAAGTEPDVALVDVLIERCAIEPDFFVRDMLTWALARHSSAVTVPRLLAQLREPSAQARSQALHTLSKIGDSSAWPFITSSLLRDPDDEVARSAWRAAVVLAPVEDRATLADDLASQLGRGTREVQRSLSRAMVALGDVIEPALLTALAVDDVSVRAHAEATQRLLQDPEAGFDSLLDEASR